MRTGDNEDRSNRYVSPLLISRPSAHLLTLSHHHLLVIVISALPTVEAAMLVTTTQATTFTSLVSATAPPTVTSRMRLASTELYVSSQNFFAITR